MVPGWAKVGFGVLVLALGFVVGARLHSALTSGETVRSVARAPAHPETQVRAAGGTRTRAKALPPALAGTNHPEHHEATPAAGGEAARQSFAALEGSIGGAIGLAVVPLGSEGAAPTTFGELQVGHGWSTMKVPILVTLMREGPLSPEEEAWARSAITASDNEAAAALFQQIENTHGGLSGASLAVQETLAIGGDPITVVATAPPPPGAVSTWGQTEWSLGGAATFYGSVACGRVLEGTATEYVLGLMEEVIPEQQWGLGQASFPEGAAVAFKAGWGPEASGGYLVRQTGVIRSTNGGTAVAMMVEASSFEAGIQEIDQIADWVGEHLSQVGTGAC